jgi:hypothetical protein
VKESWSDGVLEKCRNEKHEETSALYGVHLVPHVGQKASQRLESH